MRSDFLLSRRTPSLYMNLFGECRRESAPYGGRSSTHSQRFVIPRHRHVGRKFTAVIGGHKCVAHPEGPHLASQMFGPWLTASGEDRSSHSPDGQVGALDRS